MSGQSVQHVDIHVAGVETLVGTAAAGVVIWSVPGSGAGDMMFSSSSFLRLV